MTQRWKEDPSLYDCERTGFGRESRKMMDYHGTYVEEFLNQDPVRDWESIQRCITLLYFALGKLEVDMLDIKEWKVLDCGTKDGQFPEWLATQGIDAIGTEISPDYVEYCKEKGRPVVYGDVCDMPDEWTGKYDMVFSHHLLGLAPDYWLGLSEMLRCTQPGGYMITLNDIPGNPRKHYSLIENPKIYKEFTANNKVTELFSGRWPNEQMAEQYPKEWIYFVKKEI